VKEKNIIYYYEEITYQLVPLYKNVYDTGAVIVFVRGVERSGTVVADNV